MLPTLPPPDKSHLEEGACKSFRTFDFCMLAILLIRETSGALINVKDACNHGRGRPACAVLTLPQARFLKPPMAPPRWRWPCAQTSPLAARWGQNPPRIRPGRSRSGVPLGLASRLHSPQAVGPWIEPWTRTPAGRRRWAARRRRGMGQMAPPTGKAKGAPCTPPAALPQWRCPGEEACTRGLALKGARRLGA